MNLKSELLSFNRYFFQQRYGVELDFSPQDMQPESYMKGKDIKPNS